MDIEEMTKKELDQKVQVFMKTAKLSDKKWIYNYFTGHDEWPIITDEVKIKRTKSIDIWDATTEECPL
jgi:hypothetical protein